MEILTIRHVTRYRYARSVAFGEHRMMLRPRESFDQHVLAYSLTITPEPIDVRYIHDVFGNCIGIARFAFLGQFLARLFRGEPAAALVMPLVGALAAILLRPWLDHVRTMIAHRTATRVQEALRGRLYDKIVALGPVHGYGIRTIRFLLLAF